MAKINACRTSKVNSSFDMTSSLVTEDGYGVLWELRPRLDCFQKVEVAHLVTERDRLTGPASLAFILVFDNEHQACQSYQVGITH